MTQSQITFVAGVAGLLLVSAPAVAQNSGFEGGIVGGSIIGGGSYSSQTLGGGGGTMSRASGGSGSPTIRNPQSGTAVGGGLSLSGQGGGSFGVGSGGSGGRRK